MGDRDDWRAPVVIQARALSSGTMSYLCGSTLYSKVDEVQAEFVEFCEENAHIYKSWNTAWNDYAKLKHFQPAADVLAKYKEA